ncbi:tetratricopeptide repeat protein [Bernardetia sp. OM2101]|uniref:tetratricopeptide repeat protein n=1 Tax=Bernardetia sp. OM2101 TaxID=3344876 RepID=UPI0035D12176
MLIICCAACSTDETKYTEGMTTTMPSDTILTTSKPNNSNTTSTQKESDSVSFAAYNDSVETVLNNLEVSEAQAQELSESMSKMIEKAQSLQKNNQSQEGNRGINNFETFKKDSPKDLSTYLYMKVDSFPQNLLPQNTKNLYIGAATEDEEQYLYGLNSDGKLEKIAKLPTDFKFNPHKKTESYYRDGRIFICSEQSYKATIICGIFNFDLVANSLTLEDQTASDLSVESISKAQKAVEQGNIIEAVGFYEQVAYPHNYMQVETETIQLFKKTYSVLERLEKEKKYDSATLILESVFEFWGTEFLLNIETPQQLQELFKNNNFELSQKEYIQILEKYGSLLLQSKKYLDAVEINKKLTQITPTSALAYLQLGNAYYNLERLQDSQNAYKKYKEIITKTGQKIDKATLEQIEKRLNEK